MKTIKKISKTLSVTMCIASTLLTLSCTTNPGMVEAMNSASKSCRNIIGIEISNLTNKQRVITRYGGKGVYVSSVIEGHPASMASIKAGDIITSINSTPVSDVSDALAVITTLEAGGRYPFRIYRMLPKFGGSYLTAYVLIETVQEQAIGRIS